jgi:myo-inositol 2-dehydrogenase/D-chiro-inositol 1-dehydrogenase
MSIGVGVIGYSGAASGLHLPVLSHLPGVQVTAIADTTQGALTAVADRYAIPARYHDYRDLLQNPTVDAVAICVPPDMHEVIGLAALEAKKHVFMEKPLALSLEQCARLVQAAESSTVTTMVGFHLRWHRLVREAHEWIASDRLGTIELLRTVFTSGIRWRANLPAWRKRRIAGGGVLIESGVHYYDLWRFLTASEVDEVQVTSRSAEDDDVSALVTARLQNGILATAGFCQGTVDSLEIDIYGSAGRLRISGYALDGICFDPSGYKGVKKFWSKARSVPGRLLRAAQAVPLGGYYANAYRDQWTGFLNAIESGTPAGASFADGREATRVALAVTQSANAHRSVRIADCTDAIAPVKESRNEDDVEY